MTASLRSSVELQARGASDSRLLLVDGATAVICPATPDRSVVNSVVVDDFALLERALPVLTSAYAEAGVRKWTVWVPARETRAAALLAGAGHVLDAAPAGMICPLDALAGPAGPEPDWSGDWDMQAVGAVQDAAYGDEPGLFARALAELPAGSGHLYLVRDEGGEPLSFVLVHDHDGDCAFWYAATVPRARRRGFVSGLLHRALTDARARGCTTSTTQATRMGEPVYARLGYRTFERIEMWERRAAG
jgi:GNAT superfamily N-acetyltransferase